MPIKKYNPTSPGRRAGSVIDYSAVITKTKPEKSLTEKTVRANGRNHHGVITAKHRGGGNKRLYRIVDFKRNRKDGMKAEVLAIEYDPNRTCFIALVQYEDGEKAYILAPVGLEVGATVRNGPGSPPEVGNCLPLSDIPTGPDDSQHRDESRPGRQARPLGRQRGAVGGEGRPVRRHHPAQRRAAPHPQRVPGDHRTGWQHRSPEREHRQGRAQPAHGHPPRILGPRR